MKLLREVKGIALVTTLMLTLIMLGISMVMLYMILQNTQLSGAQKRYRNSLDAAHGGVEIFTKDAMSYLIESTGSFVEGSSPVSFFKDTLIANMPGIDSASLTMINNRCLNAKLTRDDWGTDCSSASRSLNAKEAPDITFVLQSQIPGIGSATGFRVYTKIASTTAGSTDMSGRNLEGQATTGQPPQDIGAPYLYRIEVTGERVSNPQERANLSVLYAY